MDDEQAKGFWVNGKLVNHAGMEINADGTLISDKSKLNASSEESLREQLDRVTAEHNRVMAELSELKNTQGDNTERGDPSSTDARTSAQLKAALDDKQVQYDARLNKSGLQALAQEHEV